MGLMKLKLLILSLMVSFLGVAKPKSEVKSSIPDETKPLVEGSKPFKRQVDLENTQEPPEEKTAPAKKVPRLKLNITAPAPAMDPPTAPVPPPAD